MENLYLLQASLQIRISKLRQQVETYNLKAKGQSSISILPSLYLGYYHQLLVKGTLNESILSEVKFLNYLFNLKNKTQDYSLQKLTEKEKERVLSGILKKPQIVWKEGDTVLFPLGDKEGEGVVLEVVDNLWLIIGFSTSGKNKIKVELNRCKKK